MLRRLICQDPESGFWRPKQETEALSATCLKELNSDNHYTSLEADPPPADP